MLPDDGTDMNALIEHADQEMYEAKRTRTGGQPTRDTKAECRVARLGIRRNRKQIDMR
ncbi:hypothetical protein BamMEX5DRAFT_6710 [Burkholderia ambifaria MEX-5]|uniref:GGDEF domain-containing protein n=2 Tax=Burkholderia ambifaria TaxID=152480 RepID=B1TFZ4_9BURK|nr:hypothetical protein BamMEX5DRAFT_6710 [Burkholderia ambifaria MEX-5]